MSDKNTVLSYVLAGVCFVTGVTLLTDEGSIEHLINTKSKKHIVG